MGYSHTKARPHAGWRLDGLKGFAMPIDRQTFRSDFRREEEFHELLSILTASHSLGDAWKWTRIE